MPRCKLCPHLFHLRCYLCPNNTSMRAYCVCLLLRKLKIIVVISSTQRNCRGWERRKNYSSSGNQHQAKCCGKRLTAEVKNSDISAHSPPEARITQILHKHELHPTNTYWLHRRPEFKARGNFITVTTAKRFFFSRLICYITVCRGS